MDEQLIFPAWVNTPGFVYQAEKRAEEENLTQQLPAGLVTLQEANAATLAAASQEATRIMRRRDFQAARSPVRAPRPFQPKAKRSPSLIPVLGALSVSMLLFAFVYFGATWLAYIAGV